MILDEQSTLLEISIALNTSVEELEALLTRHQELTCDKLITLANLNKDWGSLQFISQHCEISVEVPTKNQFVSKTNEVTSKYIYCFSYDFLHRTQLETGHTFKSTLTGKFFSAHYNYCEVPGAQLFITGGPLREAVSLSTERDFAIVAKQCMLTERSSHGTACLGNYVYVVGGLRYLNLSTTECERYNLTEQRWEMIGPLIEACFCVNVVGVEGSYLFVLGGINSYEMNKIQRFTVSSLSWDVLPTRLPVNSSELPCFKISPTSTSIYFIQIGSLFKLRTSLGSIEKVKDLSQNLTSSCGPCYFYKDTVYCSVYGATASQLFLGDLSTKV